MPCKPDMLLARHNLAPAPLSPGQFNTKIARHLFCSRCGICAFYRPRSNPEDYAGKPGCWPELA